MRVHSLVAVLLAVLSSMLVVLPEASATLIVSNYTDPGEIGYGNGTWTGFAVQFDDPKLKQTPADTLSETPPPTLLELTGMTLVRSSSNSADASNVSLRVYSSIEPTLETFVGASTNAANFAGGGSNQQVLFNFTGVQLSSDTPYFFYFHDGLAVTEDSHTDHSGFRAGRIRVASTSNLTLLEEYTFGTPGEVLINTDFTENSSNSVPIFKADFTVIPEPSSMGLLGVTAAAFLGLRRRRIS